MMSDADYEMLRTFSDEEIKYNLSILYPKGTMVRCDKLDVTGMVLNEGKIFRPGYRSEGIILLRVLGQHDLEIYQLNPKTLEILG